MPKSAKCKPPRTCTWCGGEFTGSKGNYCTEDHRRLARAIQSGYVPRRDCPRCGRHDLRIASPEFAICSTCGFQPDQPDRLIVELRPPAKVGKKQVRREVVDRHGPGAFGGARSEDTAQ